MRTVEVALSKWGLRAVPPAIREQSTDRRAIVNRAYGLDRSASIPIARRIHAFGRVSLSRIHAYKITMVQANKSLSIVIFSYLFRNFVS